MSWINNYRFFTEKEYKAEFSYGDMWKNGRPGPCAWLEDDMSEFYGKKLVEVEVIRYPTSELDFYKNKEFIRVLGSDGWTYEISFDMLKNLTEERKQKLNNLNESD